MSANKKYIFVNPSYGQREYSGKEKVSEAIRGIVYFGATKDEKERGFSPEDRTLGKASCEFITDVFCRFCPNKFKEKIAGQDYVFQSVREPLVGRYMDSGIATRGLRILRKDGTYTQMSFLAKSLKDEVNWRQELNATLRQVVSPWIIDYSRTLRAHMNYTPDVGMPVTDETDLHLDHVDPPFVDIVNAWIEENNITPTSELFKPKRDEDRVRLLKDEKLAQDFIFHHALNARLQLITAATNLKKGAKKFAA